MSAQSFRLTAPPPVRALAIASVTAVVGAGLTVAAQAYALGTAVFVVGLVGLGLAVVLAGTALVLAARARWTLDLDDEGVSVTRGARTQRVPWAEIDTVALAGPRLTLVRKSGADVSVLNPRTPDDPTFAALLAALHRRLDADRGYRTL